MWAKIAEYAVRVALYAAQHPDQVRELVELFGGKKNAGN